MVVPVYINFHAGLRGVDLDHLVLYSIRRDERALWLTADADRPDYQRLAARIASHLRVLKAARWRLIVLFELPAGEAAGLAGCLAEQVRRLRTQLLELDRLTAWQAERGRTIIIAIDSLQAQNDAALPLDPPARLRWKLDAYGMAHIRPRNPAHNDAIPAEHRARMAVEALLPSYGFVFTDSDVAAMVGVYRRPDIPKSVHADRRITQLGAASLEREAVDQAYQSLITAVEECVAAKQGAVQTEACQRHGRLADPEELARVTAEVRQRLAGLATVGDWDRFSPEPMLRGVLRQVFGLGEQLELCRATLLRFRLPPLTDNPRPHHRKLVDLAYLLAAVGQISGDTLKTPGNRGYVAEITLDDQAGAEMIARYRAQLAQAEQQLQERMPSAFVCTLRIVSPPTFECHALLEYQPAMAVADRITGFGVLRQASGEPDWPDWVREVQAAIEALEAEAMVKLSDCADKAHRQPPVPHDTEPVDIQAAFPSYEQALRGARRDLWQPVGGLVDDAWPERARRVAERLLPLLAMRPTRGAAIAAVLCVALVLQATGWFGPLVGHPAPSMADGGLWLLVSLFTGLGAVGLALWRLRRQIQRVADDARREAARAVGQLTKAFVDRQARIAHEIRAQAAQQNFTAAAAALREARRHWLKFQFHARAIVEHRALLDELVRAWNPPDVDGTRRPGLQSGRPEGPTVSIDENSAVHQSVNAAYILTAGRRDSEVMVRIDEAEQRLPSGLLTGLQLVVLEQDLALLGPPHVESGGPT